MPDIRKPGFGPMRLPGSGDAADPAQVTETADRFMAAGSACFDTACACPGSADAVRQALGDLPAAR